MPGGRQQNGHKYAIGRMFLLSESKSSSYLHGAAILTAGVVIVKVIGAIYKIPLYNLLGTEGTSYFNVAYNIYALLLTISTAGLPVAMSKLVSAARALERPGQVKKVFSVGRMAFLVMGMIGTLLMLLFPSQIAELIGGEGNDGAWYSIRVLSLALICICLTSAYRGFFQGHSNMIPTTVTQIVEALSKLIFGLSLAWWFIRSGFSTEIVSAGAIAGVTLGTFFALVFMLVYKRKQDSMGDSLPGSGAPPDSGRSIVGQILRIGIPITLSSSFLSIVNLLDTALILNRLQSALGYTKEIANSLQGSYGMILTLYNLPSSIIIPITVSFMPSITSYLARKEYKDASKVTESGLRVTNLIAMPAGVGLSSLALGIVTVLYPSADAEAVGLLTIMGIASILVCIMLMTNSVLQAYGYERFTVYTVVIGGIIKVVTNWVLLGIPSIGIYGVAIAAVICYTIIVILNLTIIKTKLPGKLSIIRPYGKPALCSVIMGVAAYSTYSLVHRWLSGVVTGGMAQLGALAVAMLIALIAYVVLVIATRTLTYDDILMLPKGDKLAKRFKRW